LTLPSLQAADIQRPTFFARADLHGDIFSSIPNHQIQQRKLWQFHASHIHANIINKKLNLLHNIPYQFFTATLQILQENAFFSFVKNHSKLESLISPVIPFGQ
jgi:hypothetical protein